MKIVNSPLKTIFLIHLFFENFGVLLSLRRNFVTPFSTLALIQGSLPTNSTTPDRLRSWTETESEDFSGFWVRTLSKKSFFKRPNKESLVVIYFVKVPNLKIVLTSMRITY